MKKNHIVIFLSLITVLLLCPPAQGMSFSGYANFDYNTMVYNPMFEGSVAAHLSNFTAGLRLYSYKSFPMLAKNDPLSAEANETCYLSQYFVEYNIKPFKLAFTHNFFRTNELHSTEEMPDFSFLREAFPDFTLGAYYIYEGDIYALLSFAYNFNEQYTTEIMVEKDFWHLTFGAKNTTYMYMTEKGWSISGSPICQLYEVYLKLHLSDNTYVYINDWCYHPVVSKARHSAYYNMDSNDPMGLSIGLNFNIK